MHAHCTDENLCLSSFQEQFNEAQMNFYIKYGEQAVTARAEDMLMKQKHRMIYERRQAEKAEGA